MLSKAAETTRWQTHICSEPIALMRSLWRRSEQFQWSSIYSRETGEDLEDYWTREEQLMKSRQHIQLFKIRHKG